MNTNVTATGMQVQAKAEGGIVIADANTTSWSNTANGVTASAVLFPTSTKDASTWYHNKSSNADQAQASQADATYETLSLTKSNGSYGVGYVEDANAGYDSVEPCYYLLNTFKIKSSGENLTSTNLLINSVSVTGQNTSSALDAALRIAIKIGDDTNTYIYAPITGATTTYKVGGSSQSDITVRTNDINVATTINAINNTSGVAVSIYCYYEGEDANCKSTNASGITIDELHVTVKFGTTSLYPVSVVAGPGVTGVTLPAVQSVVSGSNVTFTGITGLGASGTVSVTGAASATVTAAGTISVTGVTGSCVVTITSAGS